MTTETRVRTPSVDAPSMVVRAYAARDHDAVVALWRRVFPDAPARNDPHQDIRRKLEQQPELFLVAVTDERIVGTVMAGFDGHRGWLHLVAVSPEARRLGTGRALVERAVALLGELGCPKVNLQVRTSNAEVVRFYQALGFEVEERISMGRSLSASAAPEPATRDC